MNWRPEGWNPIKILDEKFPVSNMKVTHIETFEAGADAILDALREQGRLNPCVSPEALGMWVFIYDAKTETVTVKNVPPPPPPPPTVPDPCIEIRRW